MQRRLLIFIFILTALVQVACQKKDVDSILVIAVDDLVSTDVTCAKESSAEVKSGIDLLCKESVRFTHAFSPSTMAVPALASILTGLYPYQHGAHHNGQFLPASLLTAPEAALLKNYRTAFFSGGAPVLRKSGLNQGFEVFDDNIVPDLSSFFRPFSKSTNLFKQWLHQEVGSSAFFSVIYAPDLIFTNVATVSDIGEPRNLSYESQLDEFNETLYTLFEYLKKINRWDRTTVILVGLNGHTNSDRPDEATVLNLHSESTQVALLIKPSQRKRDEGITWKADKNVSLVDIGLTLFDIVKLPQVQRTGEDFPARSLSTLLQQPDSNLQEDRPILLESSWGIWKGLSGVRSAVVKNHILYIHDDKTAIYNTLVDRFETNPLPIADAYIYSPFTIQELLNKNGFAAWEGLPPVQRAKLNISYARWTIPTQEPLLLKDLKALLKRFPQDMDLQNWLGYLSLEQRDWETLRDLGQKTKNDLWIYIAEKNLGTVKARFTDPCLNLLKEKVLSVGILRSCNNPLMLDFIDWIRSESRGLVKDVQRKKFERAYRTYRIDLNIRRSNIGAAMIWDVNKDIPLAPSSIDLILNLPEYQKIRLQLEKSIHSNVEPEE